MGVTRLLDIDCTCCGTVFPLEEPVPWTRRDPVECPRCGAHERHRLLAYFFEHEGRALLDGAGSLLHFAPEPWLAPKLRSLPSLEYVAADINPKRPRATVHFDIQEIPYEDDRFDVILCFSVLDHVVDDRKAMREVRRVLRPGGSAILHVPGDWTAAETYEDPSIVAPEDRERAFGAPDHWRRYGLDFRDRLRAAGLTIEIDRYVRSIDNDTVRRHWMRSTGMFVCGKRTAQPAESAS